MPRRRAVALALLAGAVLCGAAAADESPAPGIVVAGPGGATQVLTATALAALPMTDIKVRFATDHGERQATFAGPLLWAVLQRAGAVDPAKPREHVRHIITITGRDGYAAVLALAEIDPAFEGKSVILAEQMNGGQLGSDHVRLIVPGDRRGGRSVRDVVRIEAE
jgi:hypothetical protein